LRFHTCMTIAAVMQSAVVQQHVANTVCCGMVPFVRVPRRRSSMIARVRTMGAFVPGSSRRRGKASAAAAADGFDGPAGTRLLVLTTSTSFVWGVY
jgi:hypothetical protein